MTDTDIDARLARALGYRTPDHRSPETAAAIIAECERRGWLVTLNSMPRMPCCAHVAIPGGPTLDAEREQWPIALAIAFLAAVESER